MDAKFFIPKNASQELSAFVNEVKACLKNSIDTEPKVYKAFKGESCTARIVYGAVVEVSGSGLEAVKAIEDLKKMFQLQTVTLCVSEQGLKDLKYVRQAYHRFQRVCDGEFMVDIFAKMRAEAFKSWEKKGMNFSFVYYVSEENPLKNEITLWSLSSWFDNDNYGAWQKYIGEVAKKAGVQLIFTSGFCKLS